jgi:hypothetical protein
LVDDEEREEEEFDPEIHCLGDTSPFPHLTQYTYEESLMNNQINDLSKGEIENSGPKKYNLWSKKKEEKFDVPNPAPREEKPTKDASNNNNEKKAHNPSPIAKDLILEVREVLNPPPSFKFEN